MKFRFLRLCLPVFIACVYTFCVCLIGQTDSSAVLANAVTLGASENVPVNAVTSEKSKTVTKAVTTTTTTESVTKASTTKIPMLTLMNVPVQTQPKADTESGSAIDSFDFSEEVVPDFSLDVPIITSVKKTTTAKTTVTTPKISATKTTAAPKTSSATTSSGSASSAPQTATTTPKPTTTTKVTTAAPVTTTAHGWNIKLSVKNNLSSSSDYNQIVTADAYTIVCRVVQAEMGDSFSSEALKAQALAAYSYMASRGNAASVLPMSDKVSDKVKSAVSAVEGKVICYNGAIAQTVYYASSAGATANSYDIWSGHIPYLVSVDCPVDALYDKNYGIENTFTSAQMAQFVKASTGLDLKGDPSKWFTDIVKSNGYVTSITIGNAGRVTGQQFRANIMQYKIKSASFTITYNSENDTFKIVTYGYGHGVGMSQNGANFYSLYYGYNYVQILQHYYTGVTIENVN